MKDFSINEVWAGNRYNPKIVLLLGGQGAGKTHIAKLFMDHGFRLALLDQYFEAQTRKKTGSDKLNVSIQNTAMKQDYVWAATKNDNRMDYYMNKGYPFVTEKTGQNFGTILQLKKLADSRGYDVYAIYVNVDINTAIQRNSQRNKSVNSDELIKTHSKVASNIYPSSTGSGIKALFGSDFFFEVNNDNTPENDRRIIQIVDEISKKPIKNFIVKAESSMNFKEFFNIVYENEIGSIVKTINNPTEQGNMLIYNIRAVLEPGKSINLVVPEQYRHLVVRDMILAHRKGPYGHGEPNMKWEPEKNKWRDYYGAYTKVEAHDTQTDAWHTYVDSYGMPYKFAEHRPGEFEEETLHDWVKIAKVKPDVIRLSNPGNQRARPHPATGDKIDPMDQKSSSEISTLKVVFFPNVDLSGSNVQVYERFYSKKGGSQDSPSKFANFASKDSKDLEPTYGNYGAGIYPNALVLAADWTRQGRRIKQMDGGYYFVVDKESFNQVSGEVGDRIERATGGDPGYSYNGREYVKVFPVTMNGGPGTKVQRNVLQIEIPSSMNGKKILQVEVMCGDTEFRPDRISRGQPWKRLGFAHLHIGLQSQNQQQWFTASDGISVAPQMVAAAAPKQPVEVNKGDVVVIKSEQDTTYVMGWRISYS